MLLGNQTLKQNFYVLFSKHRDHLVYTVHGLWVYPRGSRKSYDLASKTSSKIQDCYINLKTVH